MNAAQDDPGGPNDFPVGLRSSIDQVTVLTGGLNGKIVGVVVGEPRLVRELRKYAPIEVENSRVIALLAKEEWLVDSQGLAEAHEIVALGFGPLGRLDRSGLCTGPNRHALVSDRFWADNGFEFEYRRGFQGVAYFGWALAERLMRKTRRPDLADRCRIGMLRTLSLGGWSKLCVFHVSRYRRTQI